MAINYNTTAVPQLPKMFVNCGHFHVISQLNSVVYIVER